MAESFIGSTITVEGEIVSEDDVVIAGAFKGRLVGREGVLVAAGGSAEAEVEATRVEVAGAVHGSIVASDRVELQRGCQAACRISSPRLLIDEGSHFTGEVATPG